MISHRPLWASAILTGVLLASIPQTLSTMAADSTNRKARVLLVTGDDYPGHHWRETAPVVISALLEDSRLEIVTTEDPHMLDSEALQAYDAVILHFQNWEKPGPNEKARKNLERFVMGGKGLVLTHFACGAWYDEWPGFEKIAGRVWFGPKPPKGKRQHDPHGTFKVDIKNSHPLAAGLEPFETRDELYTCLIGDTPIEVIASANSKIDKQEYPIAFITKPGQGRTFHCVLGHDAAAWQVKGARELLKRGVAWTALGTP
jgi:type 1 glutamine amidotransferase